MSLMLQDRFTSVSNAKTRDDLLSELLRFANGLGFKTTSAMVVVDHFGRDSEFFYVNSAPPESSELSTPGSGRSDPVMQHCKHASVPIIWNQDTFTSVGLGDRWEKQARFGFHTGMALALHLPKGLHFFISVDRDQSLPANRDEISRMVGELHIFAAHAQDAAFRVLLPDSSRETDTADLTPRELESLRWTMEGKTAWEVGRILGISEQTAVRHLNNATQKLGCVNKHHAVVKAMRLGLIQ